MKFDDQVAKLRGPYSAIFTPFDRQGNVNFDMLSRIADFQLAAGLQGFFVAGSTGEGLLLTDDERIEVIRHMVDLSRGRATVIAHVGHPSTETAARLAVSAASAGADWVASVGPIYHGTTFEAAVRHFRAIATATDLPFMLYSLNGQIDPRRDLALFQIPNVAGMKYTGNDFFAVQQLMRRTDFPAAFLNGCDELFVASLSFGFCGGIGSTYNFAPGHYANIFRLFNESKILEASKVQAEINRVTELMVSYENWSYRKAIMKYIGFDCGACRLPYAPLTDQEYSEFAAQLDQLGVLNRETENLRS